MNRPFLAIALLAPVVALAQGAPTRAKPPVIQPKITILGEFRDTTLTGALMPQESALSPRGNLVAYNTDNDLRIWNSATRTSTVVLNGWSESITWSPAGDMISFAHGDETSQAVQVWTIKLDPATGKALGPAQRVSLSATMTPRTQLEPGSSGRVSHWMVSPNFAHGQCRLGEDEVTYRARRGGANSFAWMTTALPGADLVTAGLADLRAGRRSEAAFLVSIGAARLRRAGIAVPAPLGDPHEELYRLLAARHGDAAHSRYNALVRRLVSFERAAELLARTHA